MSLAELGLAKSRKKVRCGWENKGGCLSSRRHSNFIFDLFQDLLFDENEDENDDEAKGGFTDPESAYKLAKRHLK